MCSSGNRNPYARPVEGSIELGPVVPWQPPSRFAEMTKNRSVSSGLPGPMIDAHQPSGPAARASPVSAWQTTIALSRPAFSSP